MGIITHGWIAWVLGLGLCCLAGCNIGGKSDREMVTVTDQLGREVRIPGQVKKIAALHHFGGKIIYALNRRHLLVEKSIYGREAVALNKIDPKFAALPNLLRGNGYNIEGLVRLNPDVVFLYASNDRSEMERFENAGIPVIAVKGETFEESYAAIRLIARILDCEAEGEAYIRACQGLIDQVADRLKHRKAKPLKVLFAGPKSVYSVATGNMLQNRIIELAGAVNVAAGLTGFWADVSPEQIARWDPDVVFLGSSFENHGTDRIADNPHFQVVKAVKDRKIYCFPSNVGWWDYPAPHCALGVIWSAKTLYPDLFPDVDPMATANAFYKEFTGYTFEELGGRLH